MKNKRNTRKVLIAVVTVLGLLLALLVGVAVYLTTRGNTPVEPQGTTAATEAAGEQTAPGTEATEVPATEPVETTVPPQTTEPVADMTIATPICDLHFPAQWEQNLRTEFVSSEDGGSVIFTGIFGEKETELFRIHFSRSAREQGSPIGALKTEDGYVLICLQMDPLALGSDWTTEEYREVQAMREGVNHLMEYLRQNPAFTQDLSMLAPEEMQEFMLVETPFVTLKYPGKWGDQVRGTYTAADNGGFVTFTAKLEDKDVTLFVLHIGAGAQNKMDVGYLRSGDQYLKIGLEMSDPEQAKDWSQETYHTFAAMQEGFNDLVTALEKEPVYTTNPGSTENPGQTEPPKEDQTVSTPYGELYIPGQWAEQMTTQTRTVNGGHAVTYIGKAGSHEAVLFTILYGTKTDSSFPIGTLKTDKGTVEVHLEIAELDVEESWSDEDAAAMIAMQESLNDVLQKLSENPNFKEN